MGERDLRFRVYAWLVAFAAIGGLAASWGTAGYATRWPLLLTLALAVVVSELLAVDLENGASISLTYPLGVCAIVLFGPTAAAVLAMLSMVPFLVGHARASLTRSAFNLGQVALSALLPAWAYIALGGLPLAGAKAVSISVIPGLVAAALGVFVNFALGGVGYSMVHDVSLARVYRQLISWMIPSQIALGLLGLAIAQVMAGEGPIGFALFVVPLVVARQTYRRYLSLRETYADTVRSLVAAIEAKDPYTKGHSVRVAHIAVAIAQGMALDDATVQRVEYAALLHDLGKVGISRSVLSKPGVLTESEFEQIRQHPDIGARILESVPFLDDVRPIVQCHHGRIDGGGYGLGFRGGDMPLEARILAVADSYDAMTAERPYRGAMEASIAITELRANSGTQFDSAVVEVLISAIPSLDVVLETDGSGVPDGGLSYAQP